MYFDRSPAGINAETSWGGEIVAPRRGKMYGCSKYFHTTASWQNICGMHWRQLCKKQWGQKHTFLAADEIPQTDTGKRLTQTAVLPSVPRCISPKPPEVNGWESTLRRWEGIVWDVGRVVCVPHMLLSSRRHFLEAGQEGSRL